MSAALLELAERCEQASGPDRNLDDSILLATRPGSTLRDPRWHEFTFKGGFFTVPHYTASLDAAMTLVPEGLRWNIGNDSEQPWAHLWVPVAGSDVFGGKAATHALALCAAALRARANA